MSSRRLRKQSPKPAYHHGDLRNALLRAGLALLAEGGPSSLSLREVARRAGVSHAAPYRHFESKEALLMAIAEDGFRALAGELERAAAGERDPLERFKRMGVGYVRFALGHPAEVRNMFGALSADPRTMPPTLAEASQRAFGLLVTAVAEAQRHKGAAPKDGEGPLETALVAWSLVHGLSVLVLQNAFTHVGIGEAQAIGLAEIAVRTLVEGLHPLPAGRSTPSSAS
jgi:AcrR family transcriptional regulator